MTTRRALLGAGAAAAYGCAAATGAAIVKPKPLRPGDTVGLITPSTMVVDPDQLAAVERTVKYFGLRSITGKYVGKRSVDFAASVRERLEDVHSMFRNLEVRAVFPVRGGYGSGHLLDGLDYGLIRSNPKIFIGYSDITAMHLAIHRKAGLVTFHGPNVLSGYGKYTEDHFRKALFQTAPLGVLTNPVERNALRPGHSLRAIRSGSARGRLIGGNLSLIAATMGTPYEIETSGRILFIEDVDEQPYSIDRMLTNLWLAGKLQAAAGIVFGECSNCRPRDFKPSFSSPYSLGEVANNILGRLRVPVLSGLTIGHTDDQLTLPLGVTASLNADKGELTVEEPALSSR